MYHYTDSGCKVYSDQGLPDDYPPSPFSTGEHLEMAFFGFEPTKGRLIRRKRLSPFVKGWYVEVLNFMGFGEGRGATYDQVVPPLPEPKPSHRWSKYL
jgi:hypothetical protein